MNRLIVIFGYPGQQMIMNETLLPAWIPTRHRWQTGKGRIYRTILTGRYPCMSMRTGAVRASMNNSFPVFQAGHASGRHIHAFPGSERAKRIVPCSSLKLFIPVRNALRWPFRDAWEAARTAGCDIAAIVRSCIQPGTYGLKRPVRMAHCQSQFLEVCFPVPDEYLYDRCPLPLLPYAPV